MTAAPYLSASALRQAVPDLRSEQNFPDAVLEGLISEFESLAERARGCAFTTREATLTTRISTPTTSVILSPLVQSITTLTLDGTALTGVQDLDKESGVLRYVGGFGCGELVVAYAHGRQTTPSGIVRACRLYVWREAMADKNPNTGNAYSTTTQGQDGFAFTERQSTPDWSAGRPTGWLDVDKLLNQQPDYRTPGIA